MWSGKFSRKCPRFAGLVSQSVPDGNIRSSGFAVSPRSFSYAYDVLGRLGATTTATRKELEAEDTASRDDRRNDNPCARMAGCWAAQRLQLKHRYCRKGAYSATEDPRTHC